MQATEEQNKVTLPLHNENALRQLEWESDILSNIASVYDANEEALRLLERKSNILSNAAGICSAAGIVSGAFCSLVGLSLLAAAYRPLVQATKLVRIIKVMRQLLGEFKEIGIQIYPCLKVPEHEPLDLFVILPEKAYLLISIRSKSKEEAKVVYNEANETLYTKHKKKGSDKNVVTSKINTLNFPNFLPKVLIFRHGDKKSLFFSLIICISNYKLGDSFLLKLASKG